MASEKPVRNPFRNEADAFRVLMMVVGAGAVVVAVTLLTKPAIGFGLLLVFIAVAVWRTVGLVRDWSKRGTGVDEDVDPS